jgi:hypothetical protein
MQSHYGELALKFCFTLNIDILNSKSNGSAIGVSNMNIFQEICSTNNLFSCAKPFDFHAKNSSVVINYRFS